ncbi:ARP2/3 actin-organizing complex subunit Sop2, partial [Coemansia sp. RSA 25]
VTSVRSPNLPFKSLVWSDRSTIAVSGHDCSPMIYAYDGAAWRLVKKLGEDDKNRRSATASPSNNNTAFNLFRQMDSRNQPAKPGGTSSGDGSLKSVHQNTITELHRDPAGNPLDISTSGLDGRLIQWNIQA